VKTDDLIEALARGVEPAERPRWRRNLAITLAAGLVVSILLVTIGLGARPDIGAAGMPIMMKAAFSALCAAVVLPAVVRLMRPGRPLGWRIGAVLLFLGLCGAATVVALMGEMPERRFEAWIGGAAPWCVVLIPLIAAPTAALLVWFMRAFAPTRLVLTGAAIGALSGGIAAMAYAMHCPTDSVAFVTTWYALAIAVCAALGAIVGSRFLRW
jgi:hypothetical protein